MPLILSPVNVTCATEPSLTCSRNAEYGHLLDGVVARAEIADDRREHHRDHDPQDDVLGQIVQFLDLGAPAQPRGRARIQSRSTLHQSIPTCQHIHLGAAASGRFRLAQLHCFEVRPQARPPAAETRALENLQRAGRRRAAGPARRNPARGPPDASSGRGPPPQCPLMLGAMSDKTRSAARAVQQSRAAGRASPARRNRPAGTRRRRAPSIGSMSTAMTRPSTRQHPRGVLAPATRGGAEVDDGHAGLQQLVAALDLLELEHRPRAPAFLARPLHVRVGRVFGEPAC